MQDFNALIVSSDQNFCGEMVQMLRSRGVHAGAESELARAIERAVTAKATHVFISQEFPLIEVRKVAQQLERSGLSVVLFVRECGGEFPFMLKSQLHLAGFHSVLMPPVSATRIHRKLLVFERELGRIQSDAKSTTAPSLRMIKGQAHENDGMPTSDPNLAKPLQSGGMGRKKDDVIVVTNKTQSPTERFPIRSKGRSASGQERTLVKGKVNTLDGPRVLIPGGEAELKQNVRLVADAIEATVAQVLSQTSGASQLGESRDDMGSAIFVQCNGFNGIVVVTNVVENRLHVFEKIDDFNQVLSEELKNFGDNFVIQETYPVPLDRETFKALASTTSEFVFEWQSGNTPLLVSLFNTDKIFPELRPVEQSNMCAVSFEKIEPGVRLDFDVYIRMPTNNKFFRYINSSRHLLPEQKERMEKKQGSKFEVFVSEDEINNLRQYCVGQYFSKPLGSKKKAA